MKKTTSSLEPDSKILRYSTTITGITAITAFLLLMVEQTRFIQPWLQTYSKCTLAFSIIFLSDALLRIGISASRISHVKRNWFDLIAIIPLIQMVMRVDNYELSVISRLSITIIMLLTRTRNIKFFESSKEFRPAHIMITSYFFAICSGAIILSLPVASAHQESISFINALFTSTSALSITGLAVVDTATQFSKFGQLFIMVLIELGGLGIMTFSVFLVILAGRRVGIKQRIVMHDVLDRDELSGAVRTISFIVKMTLFLEIAGAIALCLLWYPKFGSLKSSAYHAVFHSVSAFCNAGFSTFSDSLMGFASDLGTNLVICLLVIFGGLGFMATHDILDSLKARFTGTNRSRPRLRIQTVIIITVTILLTVIGALGFLAFETNQNFFSEPRTGILLAIFQSVNTRSSGFNTCDISILSPATLFLMIILMLIGASPGSTGGGLKTTTLAVLWRTMTNGFSQNRNIEILRRTIPQETIQKATTLLLFYLFLLTISILALLTTESLPTINILFEAVSAIATTGLSTGITPQLSDAGKILIMGLMFTGRLGLLTIGYALVLYQRKAEYTYAEERVMIG